MGDKGPYTVVCLDKEGFTLASDELDTIREGRRARTPTVARP